MAAAFDSVCLCAVAIPCVIAPVGPVIANIPADPDATFVPAPYDGCVKASIRIQACEIVSPSAMNRFQPNLRDALLLVVACGVAFAAYRCFWRPPPDQNVRFHLSVYSSVLTMATLGSFRARPRWRRPVQAFAFFAWCNLLFVMWGGLVLSSSYDEHRVVEASKSGMVFGFLSALVAYWLFDPPGGGGGNARLHDSASRGGDRSPRGDATVGQRP
jgi:hypothetical protein